MIGVSKAFLTNRLHSFAQSKENLSNRKPYFNANCLKSLAHTITYFNPSIAFFAMLCAAFYAALWEQRIANEICFLLLVNT